MKICLPVLLFAAYLMVGTALAVEGHLHESDTEGSSGELILNNGKKWATDEPLRTGMENIHVLIEKRAQSNKTTAATNAEYDALAKGLQNEINYIFRNCHLDKNADAVLHHILADMLKGISVLEGKQKLSRSDGITYITQALDRYGKSFDHPGWVVLKLH